jgi:hypothetical protein
VLLKLKFKPIAKDEAKIDILRGHIADNATLEEDVYKATGESPIALSL